MRLSLPLVLLALSLALGVSARDRGQAAGNAIAPRLTLVGGPVAASAAVSLRACITNDQPFSNAQLATGDALRLTLSDGMLLECALEPSSPGVGDDADWTCVIEGQSIELTYLGAPRAWAAEELRCLRIGWMAPSATTTLRFESQPVVSGRMAPAAPATLVVPIGVTSGGGGGVGAGVHLRSTSCEPAVGGEPPMVIPGLDTTLEVSAGSQVAAWIDAYAFDASWGAGGINWLVLLVDGTVVSRRPLVYWGWWGSTLDWGLPAHLSFVTPPLTAGSHRIQAGIENEGPPGSLSYCVGSFNIDRASFLTLVEIRPN